ncbi:MAG TPA: DUF192 domain-containing protein [Lysobacter sp.]|nr:DUF192 domain-containing protein [Lysobacter sp.]
MVNNLIKLVVMASAMLALAGCDAGEPFVVVKGERFIVEIAADEATRAQGLMFRDEMADDRGMFFIFPDQRPRSFWMKNTRIPLDILYFDADRRLVSQQRDVPPCSLGDRCPPYPSAAPARFVLELNAGEAARLALKDGTELMLGPGIAVPAPQD